MKKTYVSDLLDIEDVLNLRAGENLFIAAGVGSGKTTFFLQVIIQLVEEGYTVQIFVHRKLLRNQYLEDFNRMLENMPGKAAEFWNGVRISSYQELESVKKKGREFPQSDYIICDEVQYFLDDSIFNPNTMYAYEWIKKQITSVRVYLSGTAEEFLNYIKSDQAMIGIRDPDFPNVYIRGDSRNLYQYQMPNDYSELPICYLRNEFEIFQLLEESDEEHKSLIFVESKDKGAKYLEHLKKNGISAEFLNADNKEEENGVSETVEYMALSRSYRQKVLITTSVLDAGVSLEDSRIDKVIILVTEKNTFMQMLGRVRKQNGKDNFTLYIMNQDISYFTRRMSYLLGESELEIVSEFIRKFVSQSGEIRENWKIQMDEPNRVAIIEKNIVFIENQWRINWLRYQKMLQQRNFLSKIVTRIQKEKYGFLCEQLEWLGVEYNAKAWYWRKLVDKLNQTIGNLVEQSDILVGKKQQLEFVQKIISLIQAIDGEVVINGKVSADNFNYFTYKYHLPWTIQVFPEKKPVQYRVYNSLLKKSVLHNIEWREEDEIKEVEA